MAIEIKPRELFDCLLIRNPKKLYDYLNFDESFIDYGIMDFFYELSEYPITILDEVKDEYIEEERLIEILEFFNKIMERNKFIDEPVMIEKRDITTLENHNFIKKVNSSIEKSIQTELEYIAKLHGFKEYAVVKYLI